MGQTAPPKVFISYSWDSEDHKIWVRDLATRLRNDGVDVTLDQWHVNLGEQLPAFMERAIRDNDFVLIICTPRYRHKSEGRLGGVGYEGDIIQGEVFIKGNHTKFIPVLPTGKWEDAAPHQLLGKAYLNLGDKGTYDASYAKLLGTLHRAQVSQVPAIGTYVPRQSKAPQWRECDAFTGHSHDVAFVAITDDGTRAASMSREFWGMPKNKTFSIWEVESRRELIRCTLSMRDDRRQRGMRGVNCLAMSADGSRIVASGDHAEVFYIDHDPIIKRSLLGDPLPGRPGMFTVDLIYHAAISADNHTAVGCDYQTLRWWNLDTGMQIMAHKCKKEFSGPTSSLTVSKDSSVALYAIKKDIVVFDLRKRQEIRSLCGHLKTVTCIALSEDGRIAVSGSDDNTIKLWDVSAGCELRTISGFNKSVNLVAVSANADIVVSASDNYLLRAHDLQNDRIWTLAAADYSVCSLAMTPDANTIVAGTTNKIVRIWKRQGI